MKRFDDDGNPMDGYDYSQHFSNKGGVVIGSYTAATVIPTSPDVDIETADLP